MSTEYEGLDIDELLVLSRTDAEFAGDMAEQARVLRSMSEALTDSVDLMRHVMTTLFGAPEEDASGSPVWAGDAADVSRGYLQELFETADTAPSVMATNAETLDAFSTKVTDTLITIDTLHVESTTGDDATRAGGTKQAREILQKATSAYLETATAMPEPGGYTGPRHSSGNQEDWTVEYGAVESGSGTPLEPFSTSHGDQSSPQLQAGPPGAVAAPAPAPASMPVAPPVSTGPSPLLMGVPTTLPPVIGSRPAAGPTPTPPGNQGPFTPTPGIRPPVPSVPRPPISVLPPVIGGRPPSPGHPPISGRPGVPSTPVVPVRPSNPGLFPAPRSTVPPVIGGRPGVPPTPMPTTPAPSTPPPSSHPPVRPSVFVPRPGGTVPPVIGARPPTPGMPPGTGGHGGTVFRPPLGSGPVGGGNRTTGWRPPITPAAGSAAAGPVKAGAPSPTGMPPGRPGAHGSGVVPIRPVTVGSGASGRNRGSERAGRSAGPRIVIRHGRPVIDPRHLSADGRWKPVPGATASQQRPALGHKLTPVPDKPVAAKLTPSPGQRYKRWVSRGEHTAEKVITRGKWRRRSAAPKVGQEIFAKADAEEAKKEAAKTPLPEWVPAPTVVPPVIKGRETGSRGN